MHIHLSFSRNLSRNDCAQLGLIYIVSPLTSSAPLGNNSDGQSHHNNVRQGIVLFKNGVSSIQRQTLQTDFLLTKTVMKPKDGILDK